jgi:cobalt transporter subunit CbtB
MMILYFVAVEQGALSLVAGRWVHEFVHDARHALAFPCH